MTGCGNYGLVGYACGRVDKFNMQSGAHRGTFWAEAPVGHTGSIHGVEVTGLNEMVISASFDGSVKLWDFEERRLLHSFETASPVTQMQLNRDNSLLAVCCDDLKVRVYDVSSRRLVRVFQGHTNRITDVCLSGDGRWVITASADRSLRIYDIPTARLIDWVPARPCPSCLLAGWLPACLPALRAPPCSRDQSSKDPPLGVCYIRSTLAVGRDARQDRASARPRLP